ncbi:mechanosensitive ion channel family protein [Thermococcus sp.]
MSWTFWNSTVLGKNMQGLTISTLLEALLILIITLFLGRLLRRLIIRASKTTHFPWIVNQDTADISFRMFVLGGVIGALYKVGVMAYSIAGTTVGNIAFAVGFFYFMYLLARKSKDYLLMSAGKKPSPELQIQAKVFYYTVLTISFLLALNLAGIGTYLGAILAAAGITGIVLGFSAQTVVSNFISGLFMYFDRPLKIGDPVKIGDLGGVVEDMRILSTRIRSWDGTLIRIPNEKLFNSNIINLQHYPARRLDIKVGIAYSADADRAMEVIKKTLDEMPLVLAEPEPLVFVDDLGDNAVVISIRVWTPSEKWFTVKTELVHRVKKALDDAGIEIPFPQRVNWFAEELKVRIEDR